MWKEAVVSQFKVLPQNLRGETEEKYEKPHSQDSRSPGRNLNPGPPEYEAGVQKGLLIQRNEL
jgi:hypothetical protein